MSFLEVFGPLPSFVLFPSSVDFQYICKARAALSERKAITVGLNLHTWVRVHALAPDVSVFHVIDTLLKWGAHNGLCISAGNGCQLERP